MYIFVYIYTCRPILDIDTCTLYYIYIPQAKDALKCYI